ncbi:MAG: hypothetical protein Q9184_007476, partial [Pyrenodesmia sp. 2 TL-2023]
SKASDKATDQAKKILDQGAVDTTKQRRDNIADLYRDLDNAMDDTEVKWNIFKEAAETYAYWFMAHEETTNKLEAFTTNKASHDEDIETHKQHVGKLATAARDLNRLHTQPHPHAQTARARAITQATQRAINPEALRTTTVYSTVKPGSERHAQRVTKANDDILMAGVQLRDMVAHESSLNRAADIARQRKNAASMALEAARKEHDKARITSKACMEGIAAYAKALGEESILTRAYELNLLKWQASERVPHQRYGEVCAWVEGKVAEMEAAGVEDVDAAVREAMAALDLKAEGQGQGDAGAKAGEVGGKKGGKGGKGKKKSKGKGKGKNLDISRKGKIGGGLPVGFFGSVRESDDVATAPAEAGGADGKGGAGAEGGEEGEDARPGDGDAVLVQPGEEHVDGLEGGDADCGPVILERRYKHHEANKAWIYGTVTSSAMTVNYTFKTLLPPDASLQFLAIIEATGVPDHLAAGPSLDVWTSVKETREWLHNCLIKDANPDENEEDNDNAELRPWQQTSGRQSRHGILLGVKDDHGKIGGTGPEITEVLLYAGATRSPQHVYAPPSPPASSSPGWDSQLDGEKSSLRLFALPLSSKILEGLEHTPEAQRVAIEPSGEGFYHPPTPPDGQPLRQDNHVPKRAKIETLFNDAAQNRRQQMKRGGEGMAKAMAGMGNGTAMPALPSPTLPQPVQSKENRPPASTGRAPLSRALTTGSVASRRSDTQPISRPQHSRRPSLMNGQPPSLSRFTSALSSSVQDTTSQVPEDSNNNIEQQNKNALSRIIMTGMRMYGFQPQRKKSISSIADSQSRLLSSIHGAATTGTDDRQDEYKAVYHQTFKAASFVFRKYWASRLVGQDILRDLVDGLLGRFCQDPFAELTLDASFGSGEPVFSQKQ